MKFFVINTDYPLEVHREGCADIAKKARQGFQTDWPISGDTVEEAVAKEAAELNSQFDHPYKTEYLFKVFPCCRGGAK